MVVATTGGSGGVDGAGGAGGAGGTAVVVTAVATRPQGAGGGAAAAGGTGGKPAAVGCADRGLSSCACRTHCRRCAATGGSVAPPATRRRSARGVESGVAAAGWLSTVGSAGPKAAAPSLELTHWVCGAGLRIRREGPHGRGCGAVLCCRGGRGGVAAVAAAAAAATGVTPLL